jgi:hypothetical protein
MVGVCSNVECVLATIKVLGEVHLMVGHLGIDY